MLEKFRIVKRLKMFFYFSQCQPDFRFELNSHKSLVFVSFNISNQRKIVNI